MLSVAVVATGVEVSDASNTLTATAGTGAPEVSSRTVPLTPEVPPPAPLPCAAAICSARLRSAVDCPTRRDIASVINTANTVIAASSPNSESAPRASTARCRNVAFASGGVSARARAAASSGSGAKKPSVGTSSR